MVDNPAHSPTADSLVAVTGATGHVGNVLVRQLLARGARVRALVPHGEDITPLRDMQVELVTADVRDFDFMKGIAAPTSFSTWAGSSLSPRVCAARSGSQRGGRQETCCRVHATWSWALGLHEFGSRLRRTSPRRVHH